MKYRLLAFIFMIVWVASVFSSKDTSTSAVGMFSCLIMAKLDHIHRYIIRERENGEEQ